MNSVPNYYTMGSSTKSLINFFAEATSIDLQDFYKAQSECTLARYALRDKVSIYERLRQVLLDNAEKNPKEAFLLLGKLEEAADRLVGTVEKVVGLLKKATEIDILSSTRFDGVQLFHLVQQIPVVIVSLITDILVVQCELFCEAILDHAIKELKLSDSNGDKEALDAVRKQVKEHIPVFAASVAKEIGDKLAQQLQSKLKVVSLDNNITSIESSNSGVGVEENRVAGMLGTVPDYVDNNATGESDE